MRLNIDERMTTRFQSGLEMEEKSAIWAARSVRVRQLPAILETSFIGEGRVPPVPRPHSRRRMSDRVDIQRSSAQVEVCIGQR